MLDQAKPPILSKDSPLVNSDVKRAIYGDQNDVIGNIALRNDDSNNNSNEVDKTYANTRDAQTEESDSGGSRFKFFSRVSGNQKVTLILLTVASFLAGIAFSVLMPFYPTEALERGMSMFTVGFVFGIFDLVIFATAPFFGNYLVRIGTRFTFLAGIFVAGSSKLLFGILQYCPSGSPFIYMSLLVRSIEALGYSAYMTASFALVGSEFHQNVATAFAILEVGAGLGFTLGPTIGGGLYELGGFGVPFYVAGTAVLLNGVAVYTFLKPTQEVKVNRKGSMLTMLRNPMVTIPLFSVFFGSLSIKTIDSSLAERLAPLNLSVGVVGGICGILSFIYATMSYFWGYLSDHKDIQVPLIIAGHTIFAIGYSLMGPSIFFPFLPFNIIVAIFGMVCMGVSLGGAFIPTMKCMVIGANETGFEKHLDTFALVAGLFTSTMTLGGFVGPVGVGYLIEKFDFPVAFTVVAMCNVSMVIVSSVFFAVRNFSRRGKYENIDDEKKSADDVPKSQRPEEDNIVACVNEIIRSSFTSSLSDSAEIPVPGR